MQNQSDAETPQSPKKNYLQRFTNVLDKALTSLKKALSDENDKVVPDQLKLLNLIEEDINKIKNNIAEYKKAIENEPFQHNDDDWDNVPTVAIKKTGSD